MSNSNESSGFATSKDLRVWVADSESSYYLSTVIDGSLYLLEDVKRKVSVAAIEALQSGVCYIASADIDPTEEFNPTGRRRGMKVLIRKLFITVGPNGDRSDW
ncbi:MAG: hypothetical protein JKY95_06290 [Planctomycetaceae bacterium]|nr:hypothetical protein [Planctomycetaceae bacterium]